MVLIAVIVAVCMEVGLSPGDCVLDGDPAPSRFWRIMYSIVFNMGRQLDELLSVFFLATRHLCHIIVLLFYVIGE